MEFGLRFDFRNLHSPDRRGRPIRPALDMANWADRLGGLIIMSPNITGPRTVICRPIPWWRRWPPAPQASVSSSAFDRTFYDRLRLAEDMIALDNLSRGRVDIVIAADTSREEFAMFDVPISDRGRP